MNWNDFFGGFLWGGAFVMAMVAVRDWLESRGVI
jgi:hypothetical protein